MPTFDVTHEDGRKTRVLAPDETAAKKQANHQEMTRVERSVQMRIPVVPPISMAVSAEFVREY